MQELSTASWDVRIYKRTFIIIPDAVKQQYELKFLLVTKQQPLQQQVIISVFTKSALHWMSVLQSVAENQSR